LTLQSLLIARNLRLDGKYLMRKLALAEQSASEIAPPSDPVRAAEGPHRFQTLDSLRGVCAILVSVLHFQVNSHLYFVPFVRHSFAFVDFFFVLSGWVIAYAYSNKVASLGDARVFLIRRLGRIYPLHVFTLAVMIFAQFVMLAGVVFAHFPSPRPPFTGLWAPSAIPYHLLLLQSFGHERAGSWNTASWSIGAEFWAYVVFAVIALATPKRYVIWTYGLIALASLLAIHFFAPTQMDSTFDFGLFRCLGGFFIGAIGQILWQKNRWMLTPAAWTTLETIAILIVIATVTTLGRSPWGVIMPLVFLFAVYIFAHEGGFISGLLKTRVLMLIGIWSYSIYMVQGIYMFVVFRNFPRILKKMAHLDFITSIQYEGEARDLFDVGTKFGCDLMTLVYVGMVIATAALTFRFIEVPARELIYAKSRLDRRPQRAVVTAFPNPPLA
jgi:peptidoglycan/LPS O-acetylase OafA/YrhL